MLPESFDVSFGLKAQKYLDLFSNTKSTKVVISSFEMFLARVFILDILVVPCYFQLYFITYFCQQFILNGATGKLGTPLIGTNLME